MEFCLIVWSWCLLYPSIVLGFKPAVQWQAEQVTIYGKEKRAKVFLEVGEPQGRDVVVGLLSYGVGLSVTDDIVIPKKARIPAGKYVARMKVSLKGDFVDGTSENGYRKVRVRLNEIVKGDAVLGGYGFREIMDVNILGHATSATGCHSGSFRSSRVIVNEGDGKAKLTFIVNQPLEQDLILRYRIDLGWTGTKSHATRGKDYKAYQGVEDSIPITLRAGDTSVDITIHIIDDDIPEDTEQIRVQLEHSCLSPLVNILSDSVIVDIVDNDRCPQPAGSNYYDGSCYFKVFLPGKPNLSEFEADYLCNEQDGRLAKITNEVENAIVSRVGNAKQAWIGAKRHTDPDTGKIELTWLDGSPLTFDGWHQREPNNREGDEDCVKINYVRRGFWADTHCEYDAKVRFGVCEKPAHSKDSF